MQELIVKVGVPAIVFVAMAIVGTELTWDDFRRMVRSPLPVIVAIIGQCILLPVIGWLLIRCFTFQTTIADGLLLVVACPSGAMANVYNYVGRANIALSVTLTTISCLVAVVSTPIALTLLKAGSGGIADFPVPLGVLTGQLILLLIVPVLIGMAIRRRWPDITRRHGKTLLGMSIAAIVAVIGFVISQERDQFISAFSEIVLATAMLTLLAFGAGWMLARVCCMNVVDRFTVGIVFVVRNAGIATAIAVTVLGKLEFAVFATAYFLAQLPILLLAVVIFRYIRLHGKTATLEYRSP